MFKKHMGALQSLFALKIGLIQPKAVLHCQDIHIIFLLIHYTQYLIQ